MAIEFDVRDCWGCYSDNPIMGKLDTFNNGVRTGWNIEDAVDYYDRHIAAFVIDDFDDIFFMILVEEDEDMEWEIYRYFPIETRKYQFYYDLIPDGFDLDQYFRIFVNSWIDIKFYR